MRIIKETKYLIFKVTEEKPKTNVITIINRSSGDVLATIEWYGPWRQYVFSSDYSIVWNTKCLSDVISVINELMEERNVAKRVAKPKGE
jgi:hypothetical protein